MLLMHRLLLLLLALTLLGSAARGDDPDAQFRQGLAAFNDAAYARARAAWEPLAERGNARAESALGYMYYSGRAAIRDGARAAELFHKAADQGEPTAQSFLAVMYFESDGVP